MKKIILLVFSFLTTSVFAQGTTIPTTPAGPVVIGVCPACTTPVPTPKPKPKPKPAPKKPCPTCPTCKPTVITNTETKTVVVKESIKKNTLSLLLGRGRDGITYDLHKSNIQLEKGYGWYTGIRYERKLDETWSLSGEYITSEEGNFGVGFSW